MLYFNSFIIVLLIVSVHLLVIYKLLFEKYNILFIKKSVLVIVIINHKYNNKNIYYNILFNNIYTYWIL